jgi:threonine synthase
MPEATHLDQHLGVLHRYADRIALPAGAVPVSLHEGNTPLVAAPGLAEAIGYAGELFLKLEGMNPTGSFKDRGMTVAVTAAVASGATTVLCASTGNTSASAAAYAARAGIKCLVLIPEGRIALGKLSQAVMHGAIVAEIEGNFDDALRVVRELENDPGVAIVNSINPYRIQGQKTAAFEICETLGRAPDYHALPVGNAGNITACWLGYRESHESPRMLGYQAAGAAPLVHGKPVDHPDTIATAIRIGHPASWDGAISARDESAGLIEAVTDEEIVNAYRLIASTEGVLAEPASAASVAGLRRSVENGDVEGDSITVCTLTGHGLKDPETATSVSPPPTKLPVHADAVRDLING